MVLQGRDSNIPGSDYINANYVKVGVLAGHGGKGAGNGPRLLGMLGPETLGEARAVAMGEWVGG